MKNFRDTICECPLEFLNLPSWRTLYYQLCALTGRTFDDVDYAKWLGIPWEDYRLWKVAGFHPMTGMRLFLQRGLCFYSGSQQKELQEATAMRYPDLVEPNLYILCKELFSEDTPELDTEVGTGTTAEGAVVGSEPRFETPCECGICDCATGGPSGETTESKQPKQEPANGEDVAEPSDEREGGTPSTEKGCPCGWEVRVYKFEIPSSCREPKDALSKTIYRLDHRFFVSPPVCYGDVPKMLSTKKSTDFDGQWGALRSWLLEELFLFGREIADSGPDAAEEAVLDAWALRALAIASCLQSFFRLLLPDGVQLVEVGLDLLPKTANESGRHFAILDKAWHSVFRAQQCEGVGRETLCVLYAAVYSVWELFDGECRRRRGQTMTLGENDPE